MKILAIDTTTKILCLGLYIDGKVYEYNLEVGRNLSQLLATTIQRVVAAAKIKISEIDYFACGLGPGSFTGMRIGLATIKGLSVIKDKPVVGVSSLDVLALNAPVTERLIVTALDARRELIYCSAYQYVKGLLKRKSDYSLLNLKEFLQKFKSKSIMLGDALALYGDKISAQTKGTVLLDKDYGKLNAHNLVTLALAKIKAKQFSSALNIKPIYLYPKECQIKTR
ncbi:MAG: tRNA (adenosine(37)-N6)-threonylcarbamoyltransferase complex dimerization subunit type 1 TsaB [Candidatus Omnitrophota bacterium]